MLEMPGKKVAIIPFFDPDTTASGLLFVPDQAKERSDQGMVKYVGPQCEYLQEGDVVIFPGYDGKNLEFEDEGILIIIDEDKVVARMEGETIEATEVPGIYFKGTDGTYFQCTYEFAMAFISKALNNSGWRRGLKSKDMMFRQHVTNREEMKR